MPASMTPSPSATVEQVPVPQASPGDPPQPDTQFEIPQNVDFGGHQTVQIVDPEVGESPAPASGENDQQASQPQSIPDWMRDDAAAWGITDQEVEALGTPEAVQVAINAQARQARSLSPGQTAAAQGQGGLPVGGPNGYGLQGGSSGQPAQMGQAPPQQPWGGPVEGMGDQYSLGLESSDPSHYDMDPARAGRDRDVQYSNRIQTLEARLAEQQNAVASMAGALMLSTADQIFSGLPEEYTQVIGKGPTLSLPENSVHQRNRMQVLDAYQSRMEYARARGQALTPEVGIRQALHMAFPDIHERTAERRGREVAQNAMGMVAPKPTNRQEVQGPQQPQAPVDSVSAVEKILQEVKAGTRSRAGRFGF